MGPERSISHHCPSFHKHGSGFVAPVLHFAAAALVSLSSVLFVTSPNWSLHLITISLNSHLFAVFFLFCENTYCVCAEGIYRILSEFSLCCS